jgi:serine O-acetyltransferase
MNLLKSLLDSYSAWEKSIPVNFGAMPDKEKIADLVFKLRCLLFPGYFGDFKTEELLEETRYLLNLQLLHLQLPEPEKIAIEFLAKLPKIRASLATDVDAAYDGDPAAANREEIIIAYPGIYAISVYRLAHELELLSVPMLPRIITEHAHSVTGIDIHPGAQIGNCFFIDHGTGIVIGETAVIGNNVKIYQGVTLGALSTRGGQSLKGLRRHPTVEDNVTIYSGASIFGGDTVIGKDSVLGSNVFVTDSVPAGSKLSINDNNKKENDFA